MDKLSPLQQTLLRACGSAVSPGGARGSLLVLIYHRVLETHDPILAGEPTAAEFAAQMDVVRSVCNILPLSEAVRRLRDGSLPPRAASITFDDGYANNREIAAPILKQRKLSATIFVSTGFTQGGCMWNDIVIEAVRCGRSRLDLTDVGLGVFALADAASRIKALEAILPALKYLEPGERLRKAEAIAERVGAVIPRQPMMTEHQLKELEGFGVEIGAHTVRHPILKAVEAPVAYEEIASSKATLEAITGNPVSLFAYPNGRPGRDYDATHVDQVRRCGFAAAVSTAWGAAGRSSDLLQLPRMLPWERSALKYSARLLRTYRERRAEVV
jgi:peptidoglycan/xylan/chitin deacetylase (PgdA/CDA1 family)